METKWPATMLWHVVVKGTRERRHVTYGDAGRTTTVTVRVHYAVAADDSHAAEELAVANARGLTSPVALRAHTRAIQSGVLKMREGR